MTRALPQTGNAFNDFTSRNFQRNRADNYGSMQVSLDPVVALIFIALLSIASLLMDIQGASRVLWSACGQIKDKVKHTIPRRASELEFEFLKREAEYEISPSDARNAWGSEPGSSPLDQGTNDNGHFSYEEFLARFGAGATFTHAI